MPKYGDIDYGFENGCEIVFQHDGKEVRLPIEMGQGARSIIAAYFDKLNRGTVSRTRHTKAETNDDDAVLRALEIIAVQAGSGYNIEESLLKALRLLLNKKVSEDLVEDIKWLLTVIKPKEFYLSRSIVQLIVDSQKTLSDARFKKVYEQFKPEIDEKLKARKDAIMHIAFIYEKYKDRRKVEAPKSIIKLANPMQQWYFSESETFDREAYLSKMTKGVK